MIPIDFITGIFRDGRAIFGHLFPVLFMVATAVLSIITYNLLARVGRIELTETRELKTNRAIDGLCTLAVLIGSLQTITSLCIVGFALMYGHMQVGARAFAILIQGFASTGFGIAIAIIGRGYLQLFSKNGGTS